MRFGHFMSVLRQLMFRPLAGETKIWYFRNRKKI